MAKTGVAGWIIRCVATLSVCGMSAATLMGCDEFDPDAVGVDDPRFAPLMTAVETEMTRLGIGGAAVAVIENGEITFAKGFGTKHDAELSPIMTASLFRIGSITKMMTTVGMLQQVNEGVATLSDPITDHLPDLSFARNDLWASSIRLEHLLTHTSGIVNYLESDADDAYKTETGLHDFLIEDFPTWGYLLVPPGTFYNYSNTGYSYAGLVVEVLGGVSYKRYMDENIFSPLGMHRTCFAPKDVLTDGNYSFGTTTQLTGEPELVGPESYDNPWGYPPGFAWSSILDLAEFLNFLRRGDSSVLPDDLREEMMSPKVNTNTLLDYKHYGLGLVITEGFFVKDAWYESRKISHGGGMPGYTANLAYFPELDFGFISLANSDSALLENSLETALSTLCALPTPVEAPDLEMTETMLDSVTGHYFDPYLVGDIYIDHDGDVVTIEIPRYDANGIPYEKTAIPESPYNFVFMTQGRRTPATFLFENDDDPHPKWLRTREAVAERQGDIESTAVFED